MAKYQLFDIQFFCKGGMADLYRANMGNGRKVVMRKLQEQFKTNWKVRSRFVNGLKIRRNLPSHPRVVPTYEMGRKDFLPYEIIDYVDGPDMAVMMTEQTKYVRSHGIPLLLQMAEAIEHVHKSGYVHLDIKPANYLVQTCHTAPTAHLTDFDLALPITKKKAKRLGTFNYMTPEMLADGTINPSADIFAFGVVAYNLYSGRMPYRGQNAKQSRESKQDPSFVIEPLHRINPQCPAELGEMVTRCMHRNLAHRYTDMSDVVAKLRQVAAARDQMAAAQVGGLADIDFEEPAFDLDFGEEIVE
jgi:serine/threonine protein kinase